MLYFKKLMFSPFVLFGHFNFLLTRNACNAYPFFANSIPITTPKHPIKRHTCTKNLCRYPNLIRVGAGNVLWNGYGAYNNGILRLLLRMVKVLWEWLSGANALVICPDPYNVNN